MTGKSISRRQFIRTTAVGAVGVGTALSTGLGMAAISQEQVPAPYPQMPTKRPEIQPYHNGVKFFNQHQFTQVAAIAALIVPTDEDPGATEAKVADYIDNEVHQNKQSQEAYVKGLEWIDALSKKEFGKTFLKTRVHDQIHLLIMADQTVQMRSRPVKGFTDRVMRKLGKIWNDWFGLGQEAMFFSRIRWDVIRGYYSNPVSWPVVGYFGPPQPNGYMNFMDPPQKSNYIDSLRDIDNTTCINCHHDRNHFRIHIVDNNCITCHRPHQPWRAEEKFYFQDYLKFIFPDPKEY